MMLVLNLIVTYGQQTPCNLPQAGQCQAAESELPKCPMCVNASYAKTQPATCELCHNCGPYLPLSLGGTGRCVPAALNTNATCSFQQLALCEKLIHVCERCQNQTFAISHLPKCDPCVPCELYASSTARCVLELEAEANVIAAVSNKVEVSGAFLSLFGSGVMVVVLVLNKEAMAEPRPRMLLVLALLDLGTAVSNLMMSLSQMIGTCISISCYLSKVISFSPR